jgi:hypothetical protein
MPAGEMPADRKCCRQAEITNYNSALDMMASGECSRSPGRGPGFLPGGRQIRAWSRTNPFADIAEVVLVTAVSFVGDYRLEKRIYGRLVFGDDLSDRVDNEGESTCPL